MDMNSRNQYLKALIYKNDGYFNKSKKEKKIILDQYCKNTGLNRKYVIEKIKKKHYLKTTGDIKNRPKKGRKEFYDKRVVIELVKLWKIFSKPCSERLKSSIKDELDRLIRFNEIKCSEEVKNKLMKISKRTIDNKLKKTKEDERIRNKYGKNESGKINRLLYQQIPVKIFSEQDKYKVGNAEIDLVEHCGNSSAGEFVNTLSNADIATCWWEGDAFMGKGQFAVWQALKRQIERLPFELKEIHSDNGTEFINYHLLNYTKEINIGFSRSRPNKKNDNCLVEQKNYTHVRSVVGYCRYDTEIELNLINDIYRNELRLYKNFFQPVIRIKEKTRINGKIHRKYEEAKTPYQRVLESEEISQEKKDELTKIYDKLNPAELKRNLDKKLSKLYMIYQQKQSRIKNQLKVEEAQKLQESENDFGQVFKLQNEYIN